MIDIIHAENRHHADFGWLDARWNFSFGDYYDPANVSFGPLRVFNDDVVPPGKGFDLHPHRDMEIITYVVEGELEHTDHLRNKGVVRAGEVQVMSAGKGILHAERNPSSERPVRLLQIWIAPRNKGGEPRWEQRAFTADERRGRWLPVIGGGERAGTLAIDQDAAVYVSNLPAGERAVHQTDAGRKVYLYVISGEVTVNGKALGGGDQVRAEGETELDVKGTTAAELILIDLP